jgi:UDP-N-acetylmuramate dehydrogenase
VVDLTPYNTLRLPAKARNLIEIKTGSDINKLPDEELLFLGQGANVLLKKNIPGTLALIKLGGRKIIKESADSVTVELGAGENWHKFVSWSVSRNLSGAENMALIPGTVGAAALGNIAAYGQNQEDIFVSLKAVNLKSRRTEEFSKKDMQYAYRNSIFKNRLKDKYLITSVTYRLGKNSSLELSYHAARHASLLPTLESIAKEPYTIKDVFNAIIKIRSQKLPDITKTGTAGSFFKNPVIRKSRVPDLKSRIPDLQTYPPEKLLYTDTADTSGFVKIPAGMLLDKLGWRGKRIGNVGVSEIHALIIITHPGATGPEVYEFSESMRSDVKRNFGIDLEYEVVIV